MDLSGCRNSTQTTESSAPGIWTVDTSRLSTPQLPTANSRAGSPTSQESQEKETKKGATVHDKQQEPREQTGQSPHLQGTCFAERAAWQPVGASGSVLAHNFPSCTLARIPIITYVSRGLRTTILGNPRINMVEPTQNYPHLHRQQLSLSPLRGGNSIGKF